MTTLRIGRRARYVNIDARAINDNTLSFRARGVLAWLLEKPDDWTVNANAIAARGKEGRDAIRVALHELETAGYLRRRKYRDEGGVFRSEAVVFEHPALADTPGDKPGENDPATVDNPVDHDGKPVLVNRTGFSGALPNKNQSQKETTGTPAAAEGAAVPSKPADPDALALLLAATRHRLQPHRRPRRR